MEIFTANQVNQVYVLKPNSTVVANLDATHQITKSNNLGSVGLGTLANGAGIYFKHLGAGGVSRSDLIDINNIIDIKATPASKMARNLKVATVTLKAEMLDANSKLTTVEDYILRIKFDKVISLSPENQYWKYGVVHGTKDMTATNFYKTMALSIAKNMSREAVKLVSVFLQTSNSQVEVTPATAESSLTGTYTGIVIKEVEQDWILGIKQQKPVSFTVEPTTIDFNDTDFVWGTVAYSAGTAIVNSKLMADYEYFYMGERADQYRMVNWPDYIPTTYLVDPSWQYGYDTVAIHYAYTGANHSVQKSEKDITFIVPRASTDSNASNPGALAASILTAISAVAPAYYTKAQADAKFEPKA